MTTLFLHPFISFRNFLFICFLKYSLKNVSCDPIFLFVYVFFFKFFVCVLRNFIMSCKHWINMNKITSENCRRRRTRFLLKEVCCDNLLFWASILVHMLTYGIIFRFSYFFLHIYNLLIGGTHKCKNHLYFAQCLAPAH